MGRTYGGKEIQKIRENWPRDVNKIQERQTYRVWRSEIQSDRDYPCNITKNTFEVLLTNLSDLTPNPEEQLFRSVGSQ